ncbi:copper amine oxidase N-terminal domain-containing protein [Paenibacillus rhizovicinus]|uniref:Copper amine oxidase N-terminal domain-containing protein n=1 Tax=Paenibacillus rhizovicinus TaxID=2704463 RepID=A0A6C0P8P1_9BACL|nr:copper amine oxidase N-terminal domain-containing protein [Paenibacillus rhizovicinus]QHW32902.1 copper amine oxidase N-terminal domain-containing protein [Paenibacillus rhizovicinus]
MKRFLIVLLAALFVLSFHQVSSASAAALPEKSNVYLKAGKFYILYTKPAPPFVDAHNRIVVPLRAFEDLFGGNVAYSASTKTARLTWLDHEFAFVIGSKTARMDGQTVVMDTTPVLKNGAMFLPIRIFLDRAALKNHWDSKENVLVLDDERILAGESFQDFDGNDLYRQNEDGAFRISDYTVKNKSNGTFELTVHATNITGEDIPAGKADIHPLVDFGPGYGGFATDSYSRPIDPALPAIKANGTIAVSRSFPQEDIDYIITVARLFSDS